MDIAQSLYSWIWTPSFWLPNGLEWEDFKNPNPQQIRLPEARDILYVFPTASLLVLLRFTVERFVFKPLGHRIGIVNKVKKPLPYASNSLEMAFISNKGKHPNDEFEKLIKCSGLTRRQIERWFRRRTTSTQATKLEKFSECLWRGSCYVVSCTVGLVVLWDKTWVWDTTQWWNNFPLHDVSGDLRIYYLVGSSIYVSFTITQFYDAKRKDFWEMFIHHIVTLLLMGVGWITNIVRAATVTLIVHDFADVFVEFAKVMNYANKQKIKEVIFATFVFTWILTRLYIYPSYILDSVNSVAPNFLHVYPMFTFMSYLTNILYCLHLFWTWYILKLVIHSYYSGTSPDRDTRSSTESSATELEDE